MRPTLQIRQLGFLLIRGFAASVVATVCVLLLGAVLPQSGLVGLAIIYTSIVTALSFPIWHAAKALIRTRSWPAFVALLIAIVAGLTAYFLASVAVLFVHVLWDTYQHRLSR